MKTRLALPPAWRWDSVLHALVLVRLGQELGTDSRVARAIHECVEALLQLAQTLR